MPKGLLTTAPSGRREKIAAQGMDMRPIIALYVTATKMARRFGGT